VPRLRGAVTQLVLDHGLLILFVLVALESTGVPLPGETALVAAGVLASDGHWSIEAVITVAALAAIVGDNCGYWIGRLGGRSLIQRWRHLERWSDRILPPSERFFARHGAKTVFLARFFSILRVTAAWLAGVGRMKWWRFLFWNAAGGICWATLVGLVAYYGGHAAADAAERYGLIAGVVIVALLVVAIGVFHILKRRVIEES
jgi:membrane protein DedA with SNARE-associated domain